MDLRKASAVKIVWVRAPGLPRHTTRSFALLEKACFINHQDSIVIAQMLDDVISDDVAQSVGIPSSATQPVMRGSLLSSASRNWPAEIATRSCVNSPDALLRLP